MTDLVPVAATAAALPAPAGPNRVSGREGGAVDIRVPVTSNGTTLAGLPRHPAAPATNVPCAATRRPDLGSRYHCRRPRGPG